MSVAKRRVLWLRDETWASLQRLAKSEGTNPSQIVANFAETMGAPNDHFNTRPFTPVPKPGKR
jgi:hypothetical protein